MAEGESIVIDLTKEVAESKDKGTKLETGDGLECAVCLQTCVHPAQLPCGHIFCFLCIKGIANQSRKCAMCRQVIPWDFIEHPNLLQTETAAEASPKSDTAYQWFYEGRDGWWKYDGRTSEDIEQAYEMQLKQFEILICGELYIIDLEANVQYCKYHPGWWQYDERTSKELEESYKAGEKVRELLIAGFLYIADLEAMLQIRRNDPSRRRRIKRDLATIPKKGIAGLRTEADLQIQDRETQYPDFQNSNNELTVENNNLTTPVTPSNTPQSPNGEGQFSQQDELEATIERIGNLRLEHEWPCDGDWRTQRRIRTFDV